VIVNDMTSIRINWLKAFEAAYGRKVVVTRQELLAFHTSAPQVGGLGMSLKYPSWLTNPKPNKFKVGRAAYKLPWDELDAWEAMSKPAPAPAPAVEPTLAPTIVPISTFTVAQIATNVQEIS